eukprot:COSAG04_NODE_23785_length_332_cov_0.746781_1_plen_52_part_10
MVVADRQTLPGLPPPQLAPPPPPPHTPCHCTLHPKLPSFTLLRPYLAHFFPD